MIERLKSSKKYLFNTFLIIIILFGILLRLKGLLINPSMWHDECALAWNIINKNYYDFFGKLRFLQIAPPAFMIITKFLVQIFNVSNKIETCDFVLRLIPFICGVLSIGVFYYLCKNTFNTKKAVLVALLLFSVNKILIDYSFEFKQYGLDMFLALLFVLFLQKLDLDKMNLKKLVFTSIIISTLIWFSFVSIFIIIAGFINLLLKRKNLKKLIILFLPVSLSILLYLNSYIINTYLNNSQGMLRFWDGNFISLNLSNFLPLFVRNIQYFFYPVKFLIFVPILLIYGIFLFYKEKKYAFINVVLLTFVLLIIASMLHIYPFFERLVIFLIPFFIILMVKPLDKINAPKKVHSLFIIAMFLAICLPQISFAAQTLKSKFLNKGDFSRDMMKYMVKNLKPTDNIFVNNGSIVDFYYYASFYNIKNNLITKLHGDIPDEEYLHLLNTLPKGNYWFYLSYDYSPGQVIDFLKNWANLNAKILHLSGATRSTLIYLTIK